MVACVESRVTQFQAQEGCLFQLIIHNLRFISPAAKRTFLLNQFQETIVVLREKRHWVRIAAWTCLISSLLLLVVGIFATSFTVLPSMGSRRADAVIFGLGYELIYPKAFSIVTAIASLWKNSEVVLAIVIFTFSIVFPFLKLTLLAAVLSVAKNPPSKLTNAFVGFVHYFGSWSMLDVFVIAVVVVGFKEFPGGTRIEREWGLFCFGASVFLSLFASLVVRLDRDLA